MSSKHGLDWAQQIHRPFDWYCPFDGSTILFFANEEELLDHMSSMHSKDLPHSEMILLCSRSKMPRSLAAHVCPFCGASVTLPSIASDTELKDRAPLSKFMMESSQSRAWSSSAELGSLSSIEKQPHADRTTASDHTAHDPAKMNLLREQMSKHVADHLESVALWSLRWVDDKSSTASSASAQNLSAQRGQEIDFDSAGGTSEDEAAEVDQVQVPDCPSFEWSMPPSLKYNDTLEEKTVSVTQETTLTECPDRLGDELRNAYCDTEGKQPSEFLPIDALDRIVTEERVREEIAKFSEISDDELDRHVQHVLGASATPGQTTSRKKIFAILALIDKLEAIWDFVAEGIYDAHLPFEKGRAQSPDGSRKGRLELLRKSDTGDSTRVPIRAFHGWRGAEVTIFERTQWDVHVPIFFLNTKKDPRVRHYPLQESVVLPFIEDDEAKQSAKMGGFADVWRIKFHPSHHNHSVLAVCLSQNFGSTRVLCC